VGPSSRLGVIAAFPTGVNRNNEGQPGSCGLASDKARLDGIRAGLVRRLALVGNRWATFQIWCAGKRATP